MAKFKIGDRGQVTNVAGCCANVGDTGTICGRDKNSREMFAVELDKAYSLYHNCRGLCKDKHGQWIGGDKLQFIKTAKSKFTVVIQSEGDHTTAKMLYGKEVVREAEVSRYHEDEYDEQAAIEAVVAKMFPLKEQTKAQDADKNHHKIQLLVCIDTGKSSWAISHNIHRGSVYAVVDGKFARDGMAAYSGYTDVETFNMVTGCEFVEIYNSEGKKK